MFSRFDKVAALQCTAQGVIQADFDVGLIFWHLCGVEPGFQRQELGEISTMLPALLQKSIRQFVYCHHHRPGLQPHLSTRWTGQTRLTNSQGAIHESWMARCSPRAPGFSREQYACIYMKSSLMEASFVRVAALESIFAILLKRLHHRGFQA